MKASFIGLVVFAIVACLFMGTRARSSEKTRNADRSRVSKITANRHCPCGCGRYLPGSSRTPACFGCSVGKAEITRVVDALASGRSAADIIIELNETVLVDVFADYTDSELPETWSMAVRVAGEMRQRRVVLRTPGETAAARRAIRLAECARELGYFTAMQKVLILHDGPWDEETLMMLAAEVGLDEDELSACLSSIDVRAQVSKDIEHARMVGIRSYPAITVNRERIPATSEAVRKAIRILLDRESI